MPNFLAVGLRDVTGRHLRGRSSRTPPSSGSRCIQHKRPRPLAPCAPLAALLWLVDTDGRNPPLSRDLLPCPNKVQRSDYVLLEVASVDHPADHAAQEPTRGYCPPRAGSHFRRGHLAGSRPRRIPAVLDEQAFDQSGSASDGAVGQKQLVSITGQS